MGGTVVALNISAQTWPDFYLTNGNHFTSYGVETYDPLNPVKNLYVNPAAFMASDGIELGKIHDDNQLILNGGIVRTPVLDKGNFTWNSGTLALTGGSYSSTYGIETGSGKTLALWFDAAMDLTSLTGLPADNYIETYGGSLIVSNFNASNLSLGGTMKVYGELTAMDDDAQDGNIMLKGPAASWTLPGNFKVEFGKIEVLHGASLNGGGTIGGIGLSSSGSGNVVVSGSGSTWAGGTVNLGNGAGFSSLIITNGGRVSKSECSVGSGSEGNMIVVSDAGSRLDISGGVTLGGGSTHHNNTMTVSNGAVVAAQSFGIAAELGLRGAGNGVTVTGNGSQLNIAGNIGIGTDSTDNYLIIQNGGHASCSDLSVGRYGGGTLIAEENFVEVTGLDSSLTCSGKITLGVNGSADNWISVGDGGRVIAEQSVVIGANNQLNLNSGGRLEIGTDFNASMTGFNFNSGSELSVAGQLSGLSNLESGRRLETPDVLGGLTVHGIFAPGTSPADSIVNGAERICAGVRI